MDPVQFLCRLFFDISNFLLKFWHIFNLCPLTIESRQSLIKTSIQTLFVRPAKSLLGSNCESLAINDALWDHKCGLNSAKMTLLWWKYKDYSNLKRKLICRKNILKISLKGIKTLPHTTQPHCKNSHSIKKVTEMLSQGEMCTWIRLERISIATRKRFGCYTSLPLKVGNCTLSVRASCIWIPRKSVRKYHSED